MTVSDVVHYHLREALQAGLSEMGDNRESAGCLHAETKMRLIGMSEEELWELAKQTSCPPERPVELVYKGIKQAIEEHRATASEWMNDLRIDMGKERKDAR